MDDAYMVTIVQAKARGGSGPVVRHAGTDQPRGTYERGGAGNVGTQLRALQANSGQKTLISDHPLRLRLGVGRLK